MNAQLKKIGLTPGRAILVAVLGLVLAAVWGPQLAKLAGGPSRPAAARSQQQPAPRRHAAQTTSPTSRTRRSAAAKPEKAPPTVPAEERKLTEVSVSEAAAFDPFAAPAWSVAAAGSAPNDGSGGAESQESAEDVAARFATLREKGVAMIFVSATGQAAQVGDQTLHVGDRIDGFEVIEIGPAGVVFRPAPPEDDGEAHGA